MKYSEFTQEQKDRYNANRRKKRADLIEGEKIRSRERKYKNANREKVREWGKDFYYKNREKRLPLSTKWAKKHPEEAKIVKHNYKARRKEWEDSGFKLKKSDIDIMYDSQQGNCFYCDGELDNYHIDHIIPLSKGGEHKLYNLVLSCPTCNLTKNAKDPEVFVNELLEVKDE